MPSIKRWIKSILFRFFVSLDDSFAHNQRLQPGSPLEPRDRASVTPDRPPSAATVNIARVVNAGWLITSEDDLSLVLDAIFSMPELSDVRNNAFAHMRTKTASWSSHSSLVTEIESYLLAQYKSGGEQDKVSAAEALAALAHHAAVTQHSRTAYTLDGKKVPLGVFWPDPTRTKEPRSLFTEVPAVREYKFITKSTKIGSAGSCFAMEIALWLQENRFNYVVTEPDLHPTRGMSKSCARWGIIFNTPSFRQLVERAFSLRNTPALLWTQAKPDGTTVFLDPFREDIEFNSVEEYERDRSKHADAARQAFMETDVFIFTLGMNEVWRLKSDGSIFSRAPWRIAPELVEPVVMTVEQNVNELRTMIGMLKKYNPKLKIILTVSPVPLHATFRGDEHHVIAANCHSKSILRVVAEEVCNTIDGVYYFPSYETVMYCTPDAWLPDQRHVTPEAVARVMSFFSHMFVVE